MKFLLSSQNILDYLRQQGLCTQSEPELDKIELMSAKNFNLLLSLSQGNQLLVKQERFDRQGQTAGEFVREWRMQQFWRQFPEMSYLRSWLPEILHFDTDNSIIVVKYIADHDNLALFYGKENIFPPEIASSLGTIIATIHRTTIDRQDYQDFFNDGGEYISASKTRRLTQGLAKIGPEIFGQVPPDGLKFFALYQRYDSLGKAIAELDRAFLPCCLTHNDLKLNNVLLPHTWEKDREKIELKLIDWERSGWGDPAFDLGMLIGSYLTIWLHSLVVSKSMAIEESLSLSMTPLEVVQPSLTALTKAYLASFPTISDHRPDFWRRVMQFVGLALIQTIQSTLQHQKSFNNTGICMLQVAKTLLCRPEASISTVLGQEATEFLDAHYTPA